MCDRQDHRRAERPEEILYPVNEVAAKYDASVLEETTKAQRGVRALRAGEANALPRGMAAVSDAVPEAQLKRTGSGSSPVRAGSS